MFLDAIREALTFVAFLFGLPLGLAAVFCTVCALARRRGGRRCSAS